jgi:hypothetical protein
MTAGIGRYAKPSPPTSLLELPWEPLLPLVSTDFKTSERKFYIGCVFVSAEPGFFEMMWSLEAHLRCGAYPSGNGVFICYWCKTVMVSGLTPHLWRCRIVRGLHRCSQIRILYRAFEKKGGFVLPTNFWPMYHFAYKIGKLIHRQNDTKHKLHFACGAKCLCVIWPTKFL